MKKYFFFSGMPRTGSNLLASILNQNPDIYFGHNSPVCSLMWNNQNFLTKDDLCVDNPKPDVYKHILENVIKQYYSDRKETYIIDKSRVWGAEVNLEMLKKYIKDDIKIICSIRPTLEILTSFIALEESVGNENINCTKIIDDLTIGLDNEYSSIVNLKKEENSKLALFITYDDIVNNTELVIEKIYKFLEIAPFKHTFENLESKLIQHNKSYNENLHKVRPTIENISKDPYKVLPKDIIKKYKDRYPLLKELC